MLARSRVCGHGKAARKAATPPQAKLTIPRGRNRTCPQNGHKMMGASLTRPSMSSSSGLSARDSLPALAADAPPLPAAARPLLRPPDPPIFEGGSCAGSGSLSSSSSVSVFSARSAAAAACAAASTSASMEEGRGMRACGRPSPPPPPFCCPPLPLRAGGREGDAGRAEAAAACCSCCCCMACCAAAWSALGPPSRDWRVAMALTTSIWEEEGMAEEGRGPVCRGATAGRVVDGAFPAGPPAPALPGPPFAAPPAPFAAAAPPPPAAAAAAAARKSAGDGLASSPAVGLDPAATPAAAFAALAAPAVPGAAPGWGVSRALRASIELCALRGWMVRSRVGASFCRWWFKWSTGRMNTWDHACLFGKQLQAVHMACAVYIRSRPASSWLVAQESQVRLPTSKSAPKVAVLPGRRGPPVLPGSKGPPMLPGSNP